MTRSDKIAGRGRSADQDLISKAQAGDSSAFESLLEEYYDTMYRFAYQWCGSQQDAEDITQNAAITLARSLGSFRRQSAFTSWLYRLVINVAKDWHRAQKKHKQKSELHEDIVGEQPQTEDQIYAQQVLENLHDLPDRQKESLILVFVEGYTHKEVSEILECKESTVSWYIHEAKKTLTAMINEGQHHG